jgi:2-keto-4-pentenoate hydratase/2-oxohepta-3-ene-1,7-dioic acid hydratase in catechol pathway
MRFAHLQSSPQPTLALHSEQGLIHLAQAATALDLPDAPTHLAALYEATPRQWEALEAIAQAAAHHPNAPWLIPTESARFAPAIPNPEKIICVGLNYRQHAIETNAPIPDSPILFSKFNNALAAHGEVVTLPRQAERVDYEAELAVVIGKTAREVSEAEALNYVLGYCSANDFSERNWQRRTVQWLLGKTPDQFFPLGPYLVTAQEVPDPQALRVQCWVNGQLRQDSNTADMIFGVAYLISYISQHFTLKPGDVITTGTPSGVIAGMAEPVWLKAGDEVAIQVGELGRLVNRLE